MKRLKVFYVKCLGLLCQEATPDSFRELFQLVCVTDNAPCTGIPDQMFNENLAKLTSMIEGADVDVPEEECNEEDVDDLHKR